jgi:Terminase large subunit, T4likevirus-type, N-terminal
MDSLLNNLAAEEQQIQSILQAGSRFDYAGGSPTVTTQALTDAELAYFNELLWEKIRREKEALRLYIPLPYQDSFHSSHAPERSLRAANRAGKTMSAAIEFARAVTGQDPHSKYPKKNGRAIIVCKNEKQCGEVVYRKLFKPGAFTIIRDEKTREWRPYLPNVDAHRKREAKKAPPLIPKRFYNEKSITWNKKNAEIPEKIVLKNGWEIYFFSSLGQAPQGWDIDLAWFDEEIVHPSWYSEIAMRLIDRAEFDDERGVFIGGKFMWSATPQAGTMKLYEIHNRAMECMGDKFPAVTEHTATMYDNPYLNEKMVATTVAKFANEEDTAAVRIYGEFALLGLRIFQEFSPRGVHGCKAFDIPENWTRYIAIDPGRQVCAVLFVAVPPPNDPRSKHVYIYDELYLRRCNAEIFAERLMHKMHGQLIYEALIDNHAGRVHEMGSGRTVEEQYRAALKKRNVKFQKTGTTSFTWGSDDVEARILAVKSGLQINNGESRFKVFTDKCPFLIREMEEYCNAKDAKTGLPLDKPLKLNDHLVDDLGYLAMHKLTYHKLKSSNVDSRGGYAFQALKRKQERNRNKNGGRSLKVG